MPTKPRTIKPEDLFRIKVINEAEMSPDGSQVVMSITQPDLAKNKNFMHLYLVPAAAGGGALRQLTSGDHVNRLPRWSPDGRTLAFISNREKANCMYTLSMEGGEPVRLTDRDGDVSDFAFAPDGRRIAYAYREKSARQKLERDEKKDEITRGPEFLHIRRLLHKLDGTGMWHGHYQHLYSIAVNGGRPKRLTSGDYDHLMPRYSPGGRQLAFLCNRRPNPDLNSDNKDIFVIPAAGGRVRQITERFGPITGYAWSPDGESFAYLGHFGKQGEFNLHNLRVWVVAAEGGNTRNLAPHVDNHCFNLTLSDVTEIKFDGTAPTWSQDGSKVFFTVSDRGACHLYEVDVRARGGMAKRSAAMLRASNRSMPPGTAGLGMPPHAARYAGVRLRVGGDVCVSSVSRAAHADRAALVVTSALDPANAHVLDLGDPHGVAEPVTDLNGDLLRTLRLAKPEPFRSRRRGCEVCGWVLRPPDFKRGQRYPLILQIHGGPHAQYGYTFMHEFQYMAAKGYVVLFTNPRGSIGYGLEHLKTLHHQWGVPDYLDLMNCVDDLVRKRYVDKERIFVTGGSYGGFMTNAILSKTNRFRAAVTDRSVVSLTSMMASDYGHDLADEFGGMPWERPDLYQKLSPLTLAHKIQTPLLIVHSEQDLRCPIGQAEELFTTLKYLGREVEFLRFIGESHGLSRCGRPQNRLERIKRTTAWFDAHGGLNTKKQRHKK